MAAGNDELYRAYFEKDPSHEVRVVRDGTGQLKVAVTGFDAPLEIDVNGGGVSMCAVILKRTSETTRLDLILPIPSQRGRCRMLPGSISLRSQSQSPSIPKTTLVKIKGVDQKLRQEVNRLYGEIQE